MSESPDPGGLPEPPPTYGWSPLPDENPVPVERPPTVLAGCVMAWVGGVIGFIIGGFLLSISSTSPALDTVSPPDRASTASALHIVGGTLVVWCPIVVVVAVFAYRGARWAALTLVGMAVAYALSSIVSLVTSSTSQGGLGLIWTAVSAGLLCIPRPSREWYNSMAARRASR
jgi:hypothetical protein